MLFDIIDIEFDFGLDIKFVVVVEDEIDYDDDDFFFMVKKVDVVFVVI